MPKRQHRTTKRITISILPSDLSDLDGLAVRTTELGLKPNRSAAVRHVLRKHLANENDARKPPER